MKSSSNTSTHHHHYSNIATSGLASSLITFEISKSNEEIPEMPLTPKITLLPAGCDTPITLPNTSTTSLKAESSDSDELRNEDTTVATHHATPKPHRWSLHTRSASVSSKDDGSASGITGSGGSNNNNNSDIIVINITNVPNSNQHLSVPASPQLLIGCDNMPGEDRSVAVLPTPIVTNLRDRRTSAPEVQSCRQLLLSTDGTTSAFIAALDKDAATQVTTLRPHANTMGNLDTLSTLPAPSSVHTLSPTELFSGSSSVRSDLRRSMSSLRRTLSRHSRGGNGSNDGNNDRISYIPSSMTGHEPPACLSPGLPSSSTQISFFKAFSERWRPKLICQLCLIFMICGTITSIVYDIIGQVTGHPN
jgi:hypothetical protein